MILELEEQLKKLIDPKELEKRLNQGLANLIMRGELDEESMSYLVVKNNYHTEFDGIRIYLFNSSQKQPYFRARLNIVSSSKSLIEAWYEQEYSFDLKVLDDYFDFE